MDIDTELREAVRERTRHLTLEARDANSRARKAERTLDRLRAALVRDDARMCWLMMLNDFDVAIDPDLALWIKR